jgi:hypothetical protein
VSHPTRIEYAGRVHNLIAVSGEGFALFLAKQNLTTGAFGYICRAPDGRVESWNARQPGLTKSSAVLVVPRDAPGGGRWVRIDDGREIGRPAAGWERY